MSEAIIVAAAQEMLRLTFLLVSPFLAIGVAASLVIGLLQASTRMNDLTLSFVPRFFAVLLMAYLLSSWAGQRVADYIERSAVTAGSLVD